MNTRCPAQGTQVTEGGGAYRYPGGNALSTKGMRGSRALNVVPSCFVEITSMEPPCATAISRAMYRPRPSPEEPKCRSLLPAKVD